MADSIITPGYLEENLNNPNETLNAELYLVIDNHLSEYIDEKDASQVRQHLDVPSNRLLEELLDLITSEANRIMEVVRGYLNEDDPHHIIDYVKELLINNMVKSDGSTPFTLPQSGVDPIKDSDFTTKKFVSKKLSEHINADDPHQILDRVKGLLKEYIKSSLVYSKSLVYTQNETDNKLGAFVKKDGTTPFILPLIGVDPKIDSHLATKRYIDRALYNHLADVDPHGFITTLNSRLTSYIKKKDVYDRTETYSRSLIDNIISKIIDNAIESAIQEYIDTINNKLENLRKELLLSSNEIDEILDNLESLNKLEDKIILLETSLKEDINSKECVWITSGPVESTVGHVDDNTPVPEKMTLQEIMDAIFYGSGISLEVPEYVTITEPFPITVCIHGSYTSVEYAEIRQNDEVIYTFRGEDFKDGCITVNGLPLNEDAEIVFKVYYTNGAVHEETKLIKCYLPVFVGLLPEWKFGNTITMDYLIDLAKSDNNNAFLNHPKDFTSFTFKYNFKDAELRRPFVVLPISYPNLEFMTTSSLSFSIDAFNVIDMIPLTVPGVEKDMIFKVYIYKQALSSLNQEVTFNFKGE